MTTLFLAGHEGMVGKAIHQKLKASSQSNVLTRSRAELDLTVQANVNHFFAKHDIEEVIIAAARVGGIYANLTYPAEFIYQNLMIVTNIIHAAHTHGVQKLLFLGSSCIYPKHAHQPMSEEALLTGYLEPTNEPYAIAKIAGIKLCESYNRQHGRDYRSLMPTNLYGPNDNFHPETSHVIPSLIRRFHDAVKQGEPRVTVWGNGQALREFLHVDDLASACLTIMTLKKAHYQNMVEPMKSHINVGTGIEVSIKELTEKIASVTGFSGQICWDESKPNGAPRKLLNTSKIKALGWRHEYDLHSGIAQTYDWFKTHYQIAKL